MHREDYAAAFGRVRAWFAAHPSFGLILSAFLAGLIVAGLFKCSNGG